jgi:Met-zincin
VRYIGGMYDNLALKGETIAPTEIVAADLQRRILAQLVEAIQPANLAIPEPLLVNLAPPAEGRDPEDFNMPTGAAFDHLAAARTLSAMVLEQLLEPERAARLVAFADRQANPLTLPEVLKAVVTATWGAPRDADARERSLRRVTSRVALDAIMLLGASPQSTPEVRAVALDELARLKGMLAARVNPGAYAPKSSALPQPPGAPIGER